jgi:formylglycine-generating enzyme
MLRTLLLLPLLPLTAQAKRPQTPVMPKVPSIEEVVAAEGFTPTLSQSDIYKPGAVLVPNGLGGHVVVVSDCIGVDPDIAIMSQSSIATTLSGGVSARIGAARGSVSAGVEKRLSFVDPEQRTISLGRLKPTEACADEVQTAAQYKDLSQAIVLHDVLVAIIQNTVCTKADASGGVVMLGEAEAASFSECVQESNAQVPLGYRAVELSKMLALAGAVVPAVPLPAISGTPVTATTSVQFGTGPVLGVDEKLKQQACDDDARNKGAAARVSRLAAAEQDAKAKASAAWRALSGELEKCTKLKQSDRGSCITAANQWLSQARAMSVSLPAGDEPVQTACGLKQPAFGADSRVVVAAEVATAEAMLAQLKAPDGVAPGAGGKAGIEWVNLGRFSISKTEVTVGQYRACVEAGACTAPDDKSSSKYCNWGYSGREDHPVNCVDWNQASAFAKWAGGRLPTGKEWTYAATSGGKSWEYPWGDEAATCSRAIMDDGGVGCGQDRTWPVCSKPAGNSTQGVCDLAGNVWEWTDEREGASDRVYRGGGWINSASYLRASYRFRLVSSRRNDYLGFRLAR